MERRLAGKQIENLNRKSGASRDLHAGAGEQNTIETNRSMGGNSAFDEQTIVPRNARTWQEVIVGDFRPIT